MRQINQILIIIFFILLSLGQLQRFQLTLNIAIYLHDLIVVIFLSLNWRQISLHLTKLNWPIKFLIFWTILGLIVAYLRGFEIFLPLAYVLRLSAYYFFAQTIYQSQTFSHHQIRQLIMMTGFLYLLFGLLQFLFLPDTRFLFILGWDEHYYRLISSLFDPGFTGMALLITFINWQFFAIRFKSTAVNLLGSSLLILGIILTFSRTTYLSLLVVLFFLIAKSQLRSAKLYLTGFLILLGLFAISSFSKLEGSNLFRTASSVARINNFVESFASLQPIELIFGRGLFVSSAQISILPSHARLSDNLLALSLVSWGFIGGIAFWQLILINLKKFYLTNWPNFLLLSAVLIHAQFSATLFQPFIWILLWLSLKV